MKTFFFCLLCCATIASAQQGKMPTDTISMQKRFIGEIIVGGGYGEGGSFLLGARLYYFSFEFGMSGKGTKPDRQLDYAPPHNDYTLREFKNLPMTFTVSGYYPISSRLFAYPSVGLVSRTTQLIPQSNATGWYYETQSRTEQIEACYGFGVCYFLNSGNRSDIVLHLSARNILGVTAAIGFAL